MLGQQNLAARHLGFIILPTNNWNYVRYLVNAIRLELATMRPGDVVYIPWPS